jgi:hypothetical protein
VFVVPEWEAKRRERKFCGIACHHESLSGNVNEAFFDSPSPDMAWVLGLVVTDGYIGRKTSGRPFLSIKSIDRDLLEQVKRLMESDYGIYECGLSDAGNMIYRIDLGSQRIVAGVQRWGIVPRKTLVATFPDVPSFCRADLVRGIFDGDGCISTHLDKRRGTETTEVTFLGTKAVLEPIKDHLGLSNAVRPYRRICSLRFAAKDALRRCYDSMYYDPDVPCLARKKIKFEAALAKVA